MKKSIAILAGVLLVQQVSLAKVINKDVTFTEKTYGVCSTEMTVSVKDGKIVSFSAVKGCPGNLAAIGKLLPGMEVERVIELLDDNYCSGAPLAGYTSCMDNLVEMLKKLLLVKVKDLWLKSEKLKKLERKRLLLLDMFAQVADFVKLHYHKKVI